MDIREFMAKTVEMNASDLHITVGIPPTVRLNGKMVPISDTKLMPADVLELVKTLLTEKQMDKLIHEGEIDTSFAIPQYGRFRVNAYKQRGSFGIAIRTVSNIVPDMAALGLPPIVEELANKQRGLILVTGPTGSGKSTTLASIIAHINRTKSSHILTLEDPIEYLHRHDKSIVNQREIGNDSESFSNALRAALRQDPDVILVGEMRDLETIAIAITAAETGHLVLSTLHTIGAAKTVDRIIDVFPPYQQTQIKVQLASVLVGVISQQLLVKKEGGRVAAHEIMVCTPAIKNLIREGKTHQIQAMVQTGAKFGMVSMDNSLIDLYRKGIVTKAESREHAVEMDSFDRGAGI